jgi:signal peptidase
MTAPGDDETGSDREPEDGDDAGSWPADPDDPRRDETATWSDEQTEPGETLAPDETVPGSSERGTGPEQAGSGPDEIGTGPGESDSDTFVEEWHQQDREGSRPPVVGDAEPPSESAGRESEVTWKLFTRDVVTSVLAVALLGAYLFAISGVWPPMVAIESGSMEPNMEVNDLVFLMETDRFQPAEAHGETGVVTAAVGAETGYGNYGGSGDVIVFKPDGNGNTTPIIHRAMFWVEEGENWCEQGNPEYLGSLDADDDECTASNAGFITKGDNNNRYDQASLQADRPVQPEWIVGTAEVRLPRMGWFRLRFQ